MVNGRKILLAEYNRVRFEADNVHAFFSNCGLDKGTTINRLVSACLSLLVEHRGFEPLTSTLRTLRATNCANAPRTVLLYALGAKKASANLIYDNALK